LALYRNRNLPTDSADEGRIPVIGKRISGLILPRSSSRAVLRVLSEESHSKIRLKVIADEM
jgi:hypothetical protein